MRSAALLLSVVLVACTGELRELGGGDPSPDMAGGVLSQAVRFAPAIQKDLDGLGCSAGACHGGSVPPLHLVPNAVLPGDLAANYAEVRMRAASGSASLILQKNLTGSMVAHAGGKQFASPSDATYLRWLGWVNAGAPSGLAAASDGGAAPDAMDGGN